MMTVFAEREIWLLYDDTGFVSRHDAEQALEAARDYMGVIRADIAARKP